MPAPEGSHNAATHGLTMTLKCAQMGDRTYRRLPKRLRYVQQEASAFATSLYADLEAEGGELTRDQWEALETAAAWELHRLNVLRELRTGYDQLTPDQRIQRTAEHAKAREKRA